MSERFIPRNLPSLDTFKTPEVDMSTPSVKDYGIDPVEMPDRYFSPYGAGLKGPQYTADLFEDWAKKNNRDPESLGVPDHLDYTNYRRSEALKQGAYNIREEENLRNGLFSALITKGAIDTPADEEAAKAAYEDIFKPTPIPEDKRLAIALSGLDSYTDDEQLKEDRETLSAYTIAKGEVQRLGDNADPEYLNEFKELETRAQELLDPRNNTFQEAKRDLLRGAESTGIGAVIEVPATRKNAAGEDETTYSFEVNEAAVKKYGFSQAVAKAYDAGLISSDNLPSVMALDQKVYGTDTPMWQALADSRTAGVLDELTAMENAEVAGPGFFSTLKNALKEASPLKAMNRLVGVGYRAATGQPEEGDPTSLADVAELMPVVAGVRSFLGEETDVEGAIQGLPTLPDVVGLPTKGLNDPKDPFKGALFWRDLANDTEKPLVLMVNRYAEHLASINQGGEGNTKMFTPEYEGYMLSELQRGIRETGQPEPSIESLQRTLMTMATKRGMDLGFYDFEDSPESLHTNIITPPGSPIPVVHPSLYHNKDLFEAAVASHPELNADQKGALLAEREARSEESFAKRDEQLSKDSKHGGRWTMHKIKGLHEGKPKYQIVDEYFADENNFNEFQDRVEGISSSIAGGFVDILATAPAMMPEMWGHEKARNYLIDRARENSKRADLREAFGVHYGMEQDILETVVPMVADVAITAALTKVTGGMSWAGFVARHGTKLTSTGIAKGLVAGGLREIASEAPEIAARKMNLAGYLKNPLDEKGVVNMISDYNQAVKSSFGIASASFLTAANRSGAQTYGSMYASLDGTDYTHEQKHEFAKGGALISMAVNGVITSAFSGIGRAGVDDVLVRGATRKQMKEVFARLSATGDITDTAFNKIVKKRIAQAMAAQGLTAKGLATRYAKSAGDEALEEGIISLVETAFQGMYTGEDVSFSQALNEAFHSALIGGFFGAALPAGRDSIEGARNHIERRLQTREDSAPDLPTPRAKSAMRTAEDSFIEAVTRDLEATASPLTARVMADLLREGASNRTAGGLTRNDMIRALRNLEAEGAAAGRATSEGGAPEGGAPEGGTTPAPNKRGRAKTQAAAEPATATEEDADPAQQQAYDEAYSYLSNDFEGISTDTTGASDLARLSDYRGLEGATYFTLPLGEIPTGKKIKNPEAYFASAADENGDVEVTSAQIRKNKAGNLVLTVQLNPDPSSPRALPKTRAFTIPLERVPQRNIIEIVNAVRASREGSTEIDNATPEQVGAAVAPLTQTQDRAQKAGERKAAGARNKAESKRKGKAAEGGITPPAAEGPPTPEITAEETPAATTALPFTITSVEAGSYSPPGGGGPQEGVQVVVGVPESSAAYTLFLSYDGNDLYVESIDEITELWYKAGSGEVQSLVEFLSAVEAKVSPWSSASDLKDIVNAAYEEAQATTTTESETDTEEGAEGIVLSPTEESLVTALGENPDDVETAPAISPQTSGDWAETSGPLPPKVTAAQEKTKATKTEEAPAPGTTSGTTDTDTVKAFRERLEAAVNKSKEAEAQVVADLTNKIAEVADAAEVAALINNALKPVTPELKGGKRPWSAESLKVALGDDAIKKIEAQAKTSQFKREHGEQDPIQMIVEVLNTLVERGYPARLSNRGARFGLPKGGVIGRKTGVTLDGLTDLLHQSIKEVYPIIEITDTENLDKVAAPAKQERSRRAELQVTAFKTKGESPTGVFDNNPTTVARLLARDIPVYVPERARDTKNPAIVVDNNGRVTGVWQYVSTNELPDTSESAVEMLHARAQESYAAGVAVVTGAVESSPEMSPEEAAREQQYKMDPASRVTQFFYGEEGSDPMGELSKFSFPTDSGVPVQRPAGSLEATAKQIPFEEVFNHILRQFEQEGGNQSEARQYVLGALVSRNSADDSLVQSALTRSRTVMLENLVTAAMKARAEKYQARAKKSFSETTTAKGLRNAVLELVPGLGDIQVRAGGEADVHAYQEALRKNFATAIYERYKKGLGGATIPNPKDSGVDATLDAFIQEVVLKFDTKKGLDISRVVNAESKRVVDFARSKAVFTVASLVNLARNTTDSETGESVSVLDVAAAPTEVYGDYEAIEVSKAILKRLGEIGDDPTLTREGKKKAAQDLWETTKMSDFFEGSALTELYDQGFSEILTPPVKDLADALGSVFTVLSKYIDTKTAVGDTSPLRKWLEDIVEEGTAIIGVREVQLGVLTPPRGALKGAKVRTQVSRTPQPLLTRSGKTAQDLLLDLIGLVGNPLLKGGGLEAGFWRSRLRGEAFDTAFTQTTESLGDFGSIGNAFAEAGEVSPVVTVTEIEAPATIKSFLLMLMGGDTVEVQNVARAIISTSPELESKVQSATPEKAARIVEILAEKISDSAEKALRPYATKAQPIDDEATRNAAKAAHELEKLTEAARVPISSHVKAADRASAFTPTTTQPGDRFKNFVDSEVAPSPALEGPLTQLNGLFEEVKTQKKEWTPLGVKARTHRTAAQSKSLPVNLRRAIDQRAMRAEAVLGDVDFAAGLLDAAVDLLNTRSRLERDNGATIETRNNAKKTGDTAAEEAATKALAQLKQQIARNQTAIDKNIQAISKRLTRTSADAKAAEGINAQDTNMEPVLNAPSYYSSTEAQAESNKRRNDTEAEFLGLKSGDPSSVITALNKIVNSPKVYTPELRLLAQMLLKNPDFISGVAFEIAPHGALTSVAGYFTVLESGQSLVSINPHGSNGLGLASVLLHEYYHAATHAAIRNPNSAAQQVAVARLQGILTLARRAAEASKEPSPLVLMDGLANLDEFAAHLATSRAFQRELKALTKPGQPRNFFARAWEAIMRMFGIQPSNPNYEAAINAVFDLAYTSIPAAPFSMQAIIREIAMGTHQSLSKLNIKVKAYHRVHSPHRPLAGAMRVSVEDTEAMFGAIRALVPDETIVIPSANENISSMWVQNGILYFNPARLAAELNTVPEEAQVEFLKAGLGEEKIHVATTRALSDRDLESYMASLTDKDYEEEAVTYGGDSDDPNIGSVALLARLKSEDPQEVADVKFLIAHERIRRQIEEVLYGESSSETISRLRINEGERKGFVRGLKRKAFELNEARRMARFDSRTRALLSRVIVELRAASLNYRSMRGEDSVFSLTRPDGPAIAFAAQVSGDFTPSAQDREAWEEWRPEGAPSEIPKEFWGTMKDFRPIFDMLEVPVAYSGPSKTPTALMSHFTGPFDPRHKDVLDRRNSFLKMISATLKDYQEDLTRKVNKAVEEGASREDLTELISEASGTTQNLIPASIADKIEDRTDGLLIEIERGDHLDADYIELAVEQDVAGHPVFGTLPEDSPEVQAYMLKRRTKYEAQEKKTLRDGVFEKRNEQIQKLEARYRKSALRRRDQALTRLAVYPEIVERVVDLRQILDGMSLQAKKVFNTSEQTNAHIDNQLGVYITQTYRMFHEPEYLSELTDPANKKYSDHEDVRKEASKWLLETWKREQASKYLKKDPELTPTEAQAKAEKALMKKEADSAVSYGQFLLTEFLEKYSSPFNDPLASATSGAFKVIAGNLRRRKDLPEPLKNLLGVYDKEYGEQLLVRAISNVSALVANQNMLTQTRDLGLANNWFLTEKQYKDLRKTNIEEAKKFKPIEVSGAESSKLNPLKGLYGPAEVVEALATLGSRASHHVRENASESVMRGGMEIINNATGKVMAVKTLGSIGHFFRNALSMPILALSQGYFNPLGMPLDMAGQFLKSEARTVLGRAAQESLDLNMDIDLERTELIGLGILNDSVRANTLRDMLKNGSKKSLKELEEEHKSIVAEAAKKGWSKAKGLAQALIRLEEAMDAMYKVPYYKATLQTLRDAAAEGSGTLNGVALSEMSDYDLKREAAKKVLRTAPAYSQTMPIVESFSKSPFSNIVSPFVRWKSEMWRTTINTFTEARAEMTSGNPVLQQRGALRLLGMVTVNAASVALPLVSAYFFYGMGFEEDEALRKTLPEFAQTNSQFYYTWNGELHYIDLTFTNPFSFSTDGVARALGSLMRGEPLRAANELVSVTFVEPFVDDQILYSAWNNLKGNQDPVTGLPVWSDLDDPGERAYKQIKFVAKETLSPRIVLDTIEAFNAARSPATSEQYTPFNLFMKGVYPFRPQPVDLYRSYDRYLYNNQQLRNELGASKGRLAGRKPMPTEDVYALYDSITNKTKRLNEDLIRTTRAFENLGADPATLYKAQTSTGLGKRNASLIRRGYMERIPLTKEFRQRLQQKSWGVERLKAWDEKRNDSDRVIPLGD